MFKRKEKSNFPCSIWEKLEEPRLDQDEIEELFSLDLNKVSITSNLSKLFCSSFTLTIASISKEKQFVARSKSTPSMRGYKNFAKILDRKRSQNLGIILSSIRLPFTEIKQGNYTRDQTQWSLLTACIAVTLVCCC